MGCASRLAITLDEEMLHSSGTTIYPGITAPSSLPKKTGAQVSKELGGRLLLRYLLATQIGIFYGGSNKLHFVTPTPIAPADTVSILALPAPGTSRDFAMLLDPKQIPDIWGPRYVRAGQGVEYLLPSGFPQSALVLPWEVQIV